MKIVPFKPEHLKEIRVQPSQREMLETWIAKPGYAESLKVGGPSFSAIENTRVLACAGISHLWEGRAMAWSVLSEGMGYLFVGVHRSVLRFLQDSTVRRIEMMVPCGFEEGCKWAGLLGFHKESMQRAAFPDGSDCDLYVRVNS